MYRYMWPQFKVLPEKFQVLSPYCWNARTQLVPYLACCNPTVPIACTMYIHNNAIFVFYFLVSALTIAIAVISALLMLIFVMVLGICYRRYKANQVRYRLCSDGTFKDNSPMAFHDIEDLWLTDKEGRLLNSVTRVKVRNLRPSEILPRVKTN